MYIKNKRVSLIYKAIALVVCIFGQILALDILHGNFRWNQILFYTNQSNILCLVYFLLSIVFVVKSIRNDGPDGPATFVPRVKGAIVMAITVTMLIYWFLLDGRLNALDTSSTLGLNKLWPLTNYVVHLFVPLLTIVDWVLFDQKGKFKKMDPVKWLYIPLIYYIFALIVAQSGYLFHDQSRFPYFFIDSDKLGVLGVIKYVIPLIVGFLLLGYTIYFVDRMLQKMSLKQRSKLLDNESN